MFPMPFIPTTMRKFLTFIASVEANTTTIVIPAASKSGDLAILCDSPRNKPPSDPGTTIPTGWTQAGNYYSNGTRMLVSYKKLTESDPGATITGGDGNLNERKVMGVFRPSRSIASVSIVGLLQNYSTGNLAAQSVLASDMVAPSIALCHSRGDSSYTLTASPTATNLATNGFNSMHYNIYNASPVNQSFDMPDSGTVNFMQTMAVNVTMN